LAQARSTMRPEWRSVALQGIDDAKSSSGSDTLGSEYRPLLAQIAQGIIDGMSRQSYFPPLSSLSGGLPARVTDARVSALNGLVPPILAPWR
jgi:hypothetical protein